MKRKLSEMPHLRLALLLGFASSIAVCLVFPYLVALLPNAIHSRLPLWAIVLLAALQGGGELTALAWIGLRVGAGLGLDAPLLRARLAGTPAPPARLGRAVLLGLGVGAAVYALDRFALMPLQPETLRGAQHAAAAWKGLLASFYGGIAEEVITRLFLMTLLAWVLCRLRLAHSVAMSAAATLAALAFAAAHLPAAKQLAPLTMPVVLRVMVLNSIAGLPFGLLFWRRGLEHAMVAHFSADLVLHVVAA
jgi:membrane protease YdiL (CAAX protease family)